MSYFVLFGSVLFNGTKIITYLILFYFKNEKHKINLDSKYKQYVQIFSNKKNIFINTLV